MLYYRYRSPTEISFKEMLYSEIYFSSAGECNDPFDSKTFFAFPNDVEKWERLLTIAWNAFPNFSLGSVIKTVAQRISSKCPLSFEEAFSHQLLRDCIGTDGLITNVLAEALCNILKLYQPSTRYFTSFSEINDESLMWSHYADKHQGFCLIFKAVDGHLKQCARRAKQYFRFETPGGLAPSMSYGIPIEFSFNPISYEAEVVAHNAFNCFPANVAGEIESEDKRLQILSSMQENYFQKDICWSYEREVRLTLSPPTQWLFGGHHNYSPQQRLFHYEPTQLVGVIFGMRASSETKQRILEIIRIHREWISQSSEHKRIIFDFATFQAESTSKQRKIKIKPEKIFSLSDEISSDNAKFNDRYIRWRDGWGLQFDGSRCTKVCVN